MFSPLPLRRLARRSALWVFAAATVFGVVSIGLLTTAGTPANAAPVVQCNSEQNAGAQGVRCTTTVVNYLTASGALSVAPPSTVTVTRCVGTAAQISANSGTCTTATTVSTTPVANVGQCNAVSGGGGGVAICVTNVVNHFATAPVGAFTPATVYQCVGSFVGAFASPPAAGTCQPANTGGGITSVALATVGQCVNSANGSNGGVSYMCMTVAGSTTTTTFPVHIDQCNGSVNGADPVVRAAVLTCYATVTNDVLPVPTPTATATSTPTATATSTPPACTPAGGSAGAGGDSGGAGAGAGSGGGGAGAGSGGAGAGGGGVGAGGPGGAISLDRSVRPGRASLSAAQVMCDPTPTPTATPTATPTVVPTTTPTATATATSTGTPTGCPAGTPCVVTTSSCVGPCSTTTPGCAGPCITTTTTGCAGPCVTTTTTGCAGGPCAPTTTTGCAGGPCTPTTTTACTGGPCSTTTTICAASCTTTTTTSTQCTGACTAVTTATSCTGTCASSLVEVASNGQQSPRSVPRPAATGKGRTSDSTPVGLIAGLVLAAGTLTSLGAYAVRRRRP